MTYALVVASEADDHRRGLGRIHLLKYAYLADLAHAEAKGATFTGIEWRFYKFGPWATEAFETIEPLVRRIGAEEHTFPSRISDDSVRYIVDLDDAGSRGAERALPASVALAIRRAVREHGDDTSSLLHAVYSTPPMLHARPGERLELVRPAEEVPVAAVAAAVEAADAARAPSVKQARRRAAQIAEARARIMAALAAPRSSSASSAPTPAPRYDDVFDAGQHWLDSLGGDPPPTGTAKVTIGEDVWDSEARRAPKLPR